MIIAGEASGDLHGAMVIRELMAMDPSIQIFGIGGDRMIAEGMNAQYHIKKMAFLGFIEVIRHLPFIQMVKRDLIQKVVDEKINTVVLIDYPGFNLNIAKNFFEMKKKIIYFISPQVWAWGKGRIVKIKQMVKKMLVIFPFEETMYKDAGVDAEYVGHPLVEHAEHYNYLSKEKLYKKLGLTAGKEILLVLPGSRKQEIKRIFPECIAAAEKLATEHNLQIVVACAENIDEKIFSEVAPETNFKIVKGFTYDLFNNSFFGIIKSGTSTLEAGYFKLPCVVVYSTNALTYMIGKNLAKIKNIAMANIILGETVLPELIQHDVNRDNILSQCSSIINNKELYDTTKNKLGEIKLKLGNAGASKRTAQIIYAALNEA